MIGRQSRDQLEFFVCGSLRDLVPDDHILARVDQVLDLSWLQDDVAELYSPGVGRPGIDPEAAVRLMLAGFLLGIVHDRRLLREAQVNLAIRWFAGYGLHERLPNHSSLTRIRQRWGAERFRRIFMRSVTACIEAGIAKGEIVHVDASLIRADVSWDSLVVRHVDAVDKANGAPEEAEKARQKGTILNFVLWRGNCSVRSPTYKHRQRRTIHPSRGRLTLMQQTLNILDCSAP